MSRLLPDTSADSVIDCVQSVGEGIKVFNVECEQLKSKYELLYSSFHVSVCVDASDLSDLKLPIKTFMNAELWPEGVFVKRYFKPKPRND